MTSDELTELSAAVAASIEARMMKHFTVLPMYTLTDTAKLLGVSEERVRQLNDSGEIPFVKMGRLVRIRPADINAYLDRNYSKEVSNG